MAGIRNTKKAKRTAEATAATSDGNYKTQAQDNLHMYYSDRDSPTHHLTPRARMMLGVAAYPALPNP